MLLQSAIAQSAWNDLRAMFSSDPTILGYCTLDSANQPLRIAFVAEIMHTGAVIAQTSEEMTV